MATKVYIFFAFLCLIFGTAKTDQDEDIVKVFTEFNSFVKARYSELVSANLESLATIYRTILSDLNPSPTDQRLFRSRLDSIEQMKKEAVVADEEFRNKQKSFKAQVTLELLMYRLSPSIMNDEKKFKILTDAVDSGVEREKDNIQNFRRLVHEKWQELYKSIPVDVCEKYEVIERMHMEVEKMYNAENVKQSRGDFGMSTIMLSGLVQEAIQQIK